MALYSPHLADRSLFVLLPSSLSLSDVVHDIYLPYGPSVLLKYFASLLPSSSISSNFNTMLIPKHAPCTAHEGTLSTFSVCFFLLTRVP